MSAKGPVFILGGTLGPAEEPTPPTERLTASPERPGL